MLIQVGVKMHFFVENLTAFAHARGEVMTDSVEANSSTTTSLYLKSLSVSLISI